MPVRTRHCAAVAAALFVVGLSGLPAAAAPQAPSVTGVRAPRAATVTVTGEGLASAAPDMAVVTAGVEVTGSTAQTALAAQGTAASAFLAAVREAGVADKDVRTENLSLSAVYAADPQPDGSPKVTGYQAAQTFSVKIRDLKRTGAVVQAVSDAAGDAARVNAVVFDVADPGALRSAARAAAHDDAHRKAVQYAELSGHRLGRLVSLEEGAQGRPRPVALPVDAFGADTAKVPVAPGEVEDSVTVTAVYELN
ncbi:SIMPL domain-containing protein [Streptomyces sp. VRA16 Mangrove soil]|uniref:SIMPL domain-containing protein n=1 Tax=Streptomyces sp. VRA16 Mangrove soil TaxID=2817434 RepID=UPI001A9F885F|nr:SIMPL domain-containing protein [Streptomyces sp. VRA16 Mangrove soil]MBO1329711.1 SIMPL domain-containing protein [Streptomyces sp. VRA16 Mangrove soil]